MPTKKTATSRANNFRCQHLTGSGIAAGFFGLQQSESKGYLSAAWSTIFRQRTGLLGHGSTLNDSASPTYQHTDALRDRNIFAQVEEAFWKLEPGVSAVLRGVFARRVFVVPLFISKGYFTEEVLPREMGFAQREDGSFETIRSENGQTIHYCGPIGT